MPAPAGVEGSAISRRGIAPAHSGGFLSLVASFVASFVATEADKAYDKAYDKVAGGSNDGTNVEH